MKKKLLLVLMVTVIFTSFVGCNKADSKLESAKEKVQTEENNTDEESNVGKWNFKYSKDEIDNLNNEILARVEEQTSNYGLEYEVKDEVTTEKERPVKVKYIYTDNENPDPNRLESMYYGYKIYEEDLSSGKLVMKIGFNLDKEKIKEEGKFDFAETSIGAYSEAFINDAERDYTDLNNKIYSMIEGTSQENMIENNIEGLKETVMITDNYLLYILETKEYDFKAS